MNLRARGGEQRWPSVHPRQLRTERLPLIWLVTTKPNSKPGNNLLSAGDITLHEHAAATFRARRYTLHGGGVRARETTAERAHALHKH